MWIEINMHAEKGELTPLNADSVIRGLVRVESFQSIVISKDEKQIVRYSDGEGEFWEVFKTEEEAKARYEEIKKFLIKARDKND